MKEFQRLRTLAAVPDLDSLKSEMTRLVSSHETLIRSFAFLMQVNSGKQLDLTYYKSRVESLCTTHDSLPERICLAYAAFLIQNFDDLFHLTMNQKNVELLALKSLGYVLISREDLARTKSLVSMKLQDDENALTVLTETFVRMNSVDDLDKLQEAIIEIGEKYEYTSKVYNILSLALVRAGKLNNADKIFRKALAEF